MNISEATTHTEITEIVNAAAAEFFYPIGDDGMTFAEAAQEMEDAYSDLQGFSEACYDQNSIEELVTALNSDADEGDCKTWNLDDDEWKEAVKQALLAKQGDSLIELLTDAEEKWFELED